MMEDLLERLKLLDYESEFCQKKSFPLFSRHFFSVPDDNAATQFSRFLKLVAWLMDLCDQEFTIDKFDDPTTSVNKVMLELKNMEFESDFPAGKLRQACGTPVLDVLNFLAERALARGGFDWAAGARPKHDEEAFVDEAEVDEDADVGAMEEEFADAPEEEEVMYSDLVKQEQLQEEAVLNQSMLEADLDPVEWKMELERVGPRLKVKHVSHGKEWRAHLEATRRHERTISRILPPTQQQLKAIEASISAAADRVQSKEKYINSQFDTRNSEFRTAQQRQRELEERRQSSSNSVEELSNTLAIVTDRLEEVRSRQESRGNSMTDTKPLMRIKKALKKLKGEMVGMEIRIGVVGHTLMQNKMRTKHSEMDMAPHGGSGSDDDEKRADRSDASSDENSGF
jgi:estrogen-related receptor beta like 1